MVVLQTPRLDLRRLLPQDLQPLHALYRDPEMRRFYPGGTRTLQETRAELVGAVPSLRALLLEA